METNGTLAAPQGIDWLCISPKGQTELVQRSGDELKLIFPQPGVDPTRFEGLAFERFYLQPMDQPGAASEQNMRNTRHCVDYCLAHPQWQLSLQTHKWLGIP